MWTVNDVMHRDPEGDGMLLWQKTGRAADSGLFEPKLGPDPSETPLARLLGTFGTREFEAKLFRERADGLDRKAARARRERPVPDWTPDFGGGVENGGEEAVDDVFGI